MADLLQKSGKIVFLLAQDNDSGGYGPPSDHLDVDTVFILNSMGDGGNGFQLRNDDRLPARQAMFSLLRDAYANDLTVTTDYFIEPGKVNGTAIRVALTRSQLPIRPTPIAARTFSVRAGAPPKTRRRGKRA